MKKLILSMIIIFIAIIVLQSNVVVQGDFDEVSNVSFTHEGLEEEINFINPVKFMAILDGNGYPKSADIVINNKRARSGNVTMYTPDWHLTHTGLETKYEFVVELEENQLVITEINPNGNSYIPLNGFVIAFGSVPSVTYEVGDIITLNGYDFFPAIRAIESNRGRRVLIDNVNVVRSSPMIVYYDSNYGDRTGTNQWGVEVTVELDLDTSIFSITSYREIGSGDSKGVAIPYFGFVLSAYGDPYRLKLAKGVLFDLEDELSVSGIPFVDLSATVETSFDIINPTPETNPIGMEDGSSPFPALRGPDQLIIYTDTWDNTTYRGNGTGTGTNEWGFEIAVDSEGVVVETGINVSSIPAGGFAVSGHGKGRDWLRSNAILGSQCTYDELTKTITLTTTADSYISVIKNNRYNAYALIENAVRKLFDIDSVYALSLLTELDEEILNLENLSAELKLDPDNFSKLVLFKQSMDKATYLANKVVYSTYTSRVIDSRGVWHRPNNAGYNELTLEGLKELLDDLEYNHINSVYLETFFHGYVISPNLDTADLHPWLVGGSYGEYGNDYLAAFIAEANKRNIEVHAWVQNFNVGFQGMAYPDFLNENPDWILLNDDYTFVQRNEGGPYIFADPANPEVKNFLLEVYEELMMEYSFDGLHLDYIRYPVSHRLEDTGFTNYAINEFKDFYDIGNDVNLQELFATDDKYYEYWVNYKTQQVTEFVKDVYEMMDDFETKKILSTAIFPDTMDAIVKKNQDWPTWVKTGWIDITTPMAYYSASKTVENRIKEMVIYVDGVTLNYGGIAPAFMGLEVFNNPLQVEAVRNGNAFGSVIFASQNLTGYGKVSESLLLGIFSKEAILPHEDIRLLINTMKNDIVGENSKADRIYIPAGRMTEQQRINLRNEMDRIAGLNYSTPEAVEAIIIELESLISNANTYGSGFANNRIKDDLLYLVEILKVRVTRMEIDNNTWIPPGTEQPITTQPTTTQTTTSTQTTTQTTTQVEKTTGCSFFNFIVFVPMSGLALLGFFISRKWYK
jgi:uncharacterized lipoprotein YddW (UPF0748 family)